MRAAALVFHEEYNNFTLGKHHPMGPHRLVPFFLLLEDLKPQLPASIPILTPRAATDTELQWVHDPKYIAAVKANSPNYSYNLGTGDCPIFPNMHKVNSFIVGGAIKAVDFAVQNHGVAFSILGGLHHAHPNYASGFCYYNDCAIAIEYALRTYPSIKKILYLDTDCHAGDGVGSYFYDRNDVFTLSIHETGEALYPGCCFETEIGTGQGKGYNAYLPLHPYTDDQTYFEVASKLIRRAFSFFDPDLVVWQCGMDTYYQDPITHLRLTTCTSYKLARLLHELTENRPLVCLGGGGYSPIGLSKGWLTQFLTVIGVDPLPSIPSDGKWMQLCQSLDENNQLCTSLVDPCDLLPSSNLEAVRSYNNLRLTNLFASLKWALSD